MVEANGERNLIAWSRPMPELARGEHLASVRSPADEGAGRGHMIGPCPFIDDAPSPNQVGAVIDLSSAAYLYWGNGSLYVAKLGKDMISLEGGLAAVKTITPTWQGGGKFNEGVFVFKRKGTYYFSWSENDARADNYQVAYGTSASPFGPIQVPAGNARLILENDKRKDDAGKAAPLVKGTGH